MTTATTRLLCLLGHPVAHSISPQIHSAALAATGVDAVYVACDVAPAELGVALAGLGAIGCAGANVTVPHKVAVLDHVDERTDECDAVGAANTLWWDTGRLYADNTDAVALTSVLREEIGVAPGEGVLVYGAGGAARAVAVAAARCGAALAVRARRPEAAGQVEALGRALGAATPGTRRPRVVVNATPLGLRGEALPGELMELSAEQVALDLVYRAGSTPFLDAARQNGAAAVDGLSMLVGQASEAFSRWTGQPAPRAAMAQAAAAALGRKDSEQSTPCAREDER